MKKISILFFIAFLLSSILSNAQKSLGEGRIVYNISISGPDAASPAYQSLNGAMLHVYLKPNQSRTDLVSSLGTESNVFDNRNGEGFLLKEYSGQKLMITLTKENWKQKNQYYEEATFNIEDGLVTVAGQPCKKAVANLEGNKSLVVYFNPNINLENNNYNNAFKQLPGLPVKYELQSGNLQFTYTLQNIFWESVSSAKFEMPKTGYRVMTYDENQQLKKGS